MAIFGIRLARNSSVQAKQGAWSIDLSNMTSEAKRAAIRSANDKGVVMLYMRGHIMLYLGERDGTDYAISALSEFLEPCPSEGGPDRVFRLDRVEVTTLDLGAGTERTSFIERMERAVVLGRPE